MNKEVNIKDRERNAEYLRMALATCEIGVTYQQAELILSVTKLLDKLGGNLTIDGTMNLYFDHKRKWENYFEDKES